MTSDKKKPKLSRIKTGSFERRLRLTTAGLLAGTRVTTSLATSLLASKEKRLAHRKAVLSEQALYLVNELGKLKGSVVKVGQILALFGEHFLPTEVTEALHTLEDQTSALEWTVIESLLKREFTLVNYFQLEIEENPIGAASLGQVHRAHHKADEIPLCIKAQYPGVADAIDADLNAIAQMLKLTKLIKAGKEFEEWLEEVRTMLHHEVNYLREAETTTRFRTHLADDSRFVVPEVIQEYSTQKVLTTTFELGYEITNPKIQELSLTRRNNIAKASLDLFLKEIFIWGEIQTDPNFGNYRIRPKELGAELKLEGDQDQTILLDFGAVESYPDSFLLPLRDMIRGAFYKDHETIIKGAIALGFMKENRSHEELISFAEMCMIMLEPFTGNPIELPAEIINENGEYRWQASNLPRRVAKIAAKSAFRKHFDIPPKEFVFLNRKLIGVYTFISVLGAEFNGRELIEPYLMLDECH